MSENPPILEALAHAYSGSAAGRSEGERDYLIDYEKLLRKAKLDDGDAREIAEHDLKVAESQSAGALCIDRDARTGHKLRVRLDSVRGEKFLFDRLGRPSPESLRRELALLFDTSKSIPVPAHHLPGWLRWLDAMGTAALTGASIQPFSRDDSASNLVLINAISGILNWQSDSLIRYASVRLTGDSKILETLRPRIETALRKITGSEEDSLDSFGILRVPRSVNIHGPLKIILPDGILDLSLLDGPFSISAIDISRARIELHAALILTVENESVFLELTRRNPGVLLIQTSYPGSAVLQLLCKLPLDIPSYHFGDTDPAGFDILRDLRNRSGRCFRPLMMDYSPAGKALSKPESILLKSLIGSSNLEDISETLKKMSHHQLKGVFEQESIEVAEVIAKLRNLKLNPH